MSGRVCTVLGMRRRVDFRLPVGLLARLDAEADRLGQTRTRFVERALERALGPVEVASELPVADRPAETLAPPEPVVRKVAAVVKRASEVKPLPKRVELAFMCPARDCPRRFGSVSAVCSVHGRRAVPVK